MSLATAELPTDPDALRAFALACQGELRAAQMALQVKALEIEKLRFQSPSCAGCSLADPRSGSRARSSN
jgi:hypothetical protein